ncbi:hypothetical protein [Yinghuangia sp. YIM S09857]|uniref:hypothetical protein n=1 Tax=Yinghuangia sp. YIM S09857 TaxID=3436929 RepID=UPI003F538A62
MTTPDPTTPRPDLAALQQRIDEQAAALNRVREIATRARLFTHAHQPTQVTVRVIGDTVLRALDGTEPPAPRDAGDTWPPPVIGTRRLARRYDHLAPPPGA